LVIELILRVGLTIDGEPLFKFVAFGFGAFLLLLISGVLG